MAELGWQELAGITAVVLFIFGVVAWGLRYSRKSIAGIQGDVAAFDAVLRALETPELRVHAGPVYEHPMVGVVPSHSTLSVRSTGTASTSSSTGALPASDAARNALTGKRIFLLDGDLRFAEALRAGLVDRGAHPHVFDDPQSLIDAAERSLPDLFVLALELPGENGWGVCNRLKKHEKIGSVPLVVASTGFNEAEFQMHRRLRTRAQDYISKPLSVEDMLRRIALQLPNGRGQTTNAGGEG